MVVDRLFQLVIFTGGTFFCYPHKVLINLIFGASYKVSYAHFRQGHFGNLNLCLHFLILFLQLAGNIGVLSVLEEWLPPWVPSLAVGTILLWSLMLAFTPSPLSVRIATLALLGGTCLSRNFIMRHWQELAFLQGIFDGGTSWYICRVFLDKPLSLPGVIGVVILRCVLYATLAQSPLFGVLADYRRQVNIGFFVLLAIGSQVHMRVKSGKEYLTETIGAVFGWVVAELVGDPFHLFLCTSFVGAYQQGVSHEIAGEKATMPLLTNYADELGHTTYFPVLLLHAMHQNFNRAVSASAKKSERGK